MILKDRPDVRRLVSPALVEAWLADLRGWAEVDSLCQSMFAPEELLASWPSWRTAILRLSKSQNRSCRRGALVLLTGPVRRSDDDRLKGLAMKVLDQLRSDRDPLITKAVSWLLRALTVRQPRLVTDYLDRYESELAPIAVRETRTKLRTGTKSGRRASKDSTRVPSFPG